MKKFRNDEGNQGPCLKDAMKEMNQPSYSVDIQMAGIPDKLQMPRFKQYSETTDQSEHMHQFCNQMGMHTSNNVLIFPVFPASRKSKKLLNGSSSFLQ